MVEETLLCVGPGRNFHSKISPTETAVKINVRTRGVGHVMNSKSEFNGAKLPRIVVEQPEEDVEQQEQCGGGEVKLGKRKNNQVDILNWGISQDEYWASKIHLGGEYYQLQKQGLQFLPPQADTVKRYLVGSSGGQDEESVAHIQHEEVTTTF